MSCMWRGCSERLLCEWALDGQIGQRSDVLRLGFSLDLHCSLRLSVCSDLAWYVYQRREFRRRSYARTRASVSRSWIAWRVCDLLEFQKEERGLSLASEKTIVGERRFEGMKSYRMRTQVGAFLLLVGVLMEVALYLTRGGDYILLTPIFAGIILIVIGAYLTITSLIGRRKGV